MTKNRERFLAAIAIVLTTGIVATLWHITGDCGRPDPDKPFAACRRIEDNQGLLSILAIAGAFLLYALELKEARAAGARARRIARHDLAEEKIRSLEAWFSSADDVLDRAIQWFEFITRLEPENPTQAVLHADIENGLTRARTAWALIQPTAPVDPALHPVLAELENQIASTMPQPSFPGMDMHRTIAEMKLYNFRTLRRALASHKQRMVADQFSMARKVQ